MRWVRGPAVRLLAEAEAVGVLARAGLLRPVRPDRVAEMVLGLARYGPTVAAAAVAAAARRPDAVGLVDDAGSLTFREVLTAARRAAGTLRAAGVREGNRVALLAPNGRLPVLALVGAGLIGADVLLVNTGLSAGQVAALCERERAAVLVVDPQLRELASDVSPDTAVVDDLDGDADGLPVVLRHRGRVVIMTSGTTGTPKGARRKDPASLVPPAALLSRIPLREAGATVIASPLFHTWGFANLELAMALASTVVLRRRVDPATLLADIAGVGADVLVTVPIVLSRLLEVVADERPQTPTLRVVAVSGSALPGRLASRFQDAFGDVLYNLYGSTEVSWVSIATPADLRADPGTAGKPPLGTRVALLDDDGAPVEPGEVGRIFVGNDLLFEGYTGTEEGPAVVDGMMTTGDLGRLDEEGRLTVLGRSDGMVVSGGENVFPSEVEDLLTRSDDIAEAAVIGVDDEQFGQRLAAFVVLQAGARLDADGVRSLVRAELARFSVPRDVVFVQELPRNETGKVVPARLRDLEFRAGSSVDGS